MTRSASGEGETSLSKSLAPSPQPSPYRGEGACRVRGSIKTSRLRPNQADLAIFQRALGMRRPGRGTVDRKIAPPPRRGFGVLFQPLQEQAEVEHGVGIAGIGVERPLEAVHGLGR